MATPRAKGIFNKLLINLTYYYLMRSGFSLVELSIVLVILGLLTGGILSGQSLIRAAELRSVSTDFQHYQTAVQTFRDRYFSYPGDMPNAVKFWGTAGVCPGTVGQPSSDVTTCNGDGDGKVDNPGSGLGNELFRFWQHLASSGLIEGSYAGVANSSTASATHNLPGFNSPKSKLPDAGFGLYYVGAIDASSLRYFPGNYGNVVYFGKTQPTIGSPTQPILSPEEAWNIDTKMDDGKPAVGNLVIWEEMPGSTATETCSDLPPSSTNPLNDSNYSLSNKTKSCSFILKMAF